MKKDFNFDEQNTENKKENFYNDDVKLGIKIGKIINSYEWERQRIINLINNKFDDCYGALQILKPLWDEYGYERINNLIKEILQEQEKNKEVKEDE